MVDRTIQLIKHKSLTNKQNEKIKEKNEVNNVTKIYSRKLVYRGAEDSV